VNIDELELGCIGLSDGYGRSRPSCTGGRPTILIAGSMICTTLSATRVSCWWPGIVCGVTGEHVRPGWTGRPPTRWRPCMGSGHSSRGCGLR
jgi:hypothetical protein